MKPYHAQNTVCSTLHILIFLILTIFLWGGDHYPDFIHEAERLKQTCQAQQTYITEPGL